jgi:lipopolysaccharide/colanic/teichoic acid biosynthesis glycosyltransferase
MNIGDFDNTPESRVSSVALGDRRLYGSAVGLERTGILPGQNGVSFGGLLKFYFSEYFTGILFLLALASFIFVLPESVTRSGKMVLTMIDKFFKKVIDILGAVTGLILCIPIFIIFPILIKLDSRGPVFYTQDRVGINRRKRNRRIYRAGMEEERRGRERRREDYRGQIFKVIKFRTMVNDAEKKTGPVWATKNDTRITRLGRFMRKSRVDEIPQLLNVLKGDMSLVGPRPERPSFVTDLANKVPNYEQRLNVKPGITGLAQVRNGYDSSLQSVVNKVEQDLSYIRKWSIWSDVKILMQTVVVVITGRGAC